MELGRLSELEGFFEEALKKAARLQGHPLLEDAQGKPPRTLGSGDDDAYADRWRHGRQTPSLYSCLTRAGRVKAPTWGLTHATTTLMH